MELKPSKEIEQYYKQNKNVIPSNPGVYKFLDKNGAILYIGKAKNLKKRLASYFNYNNLSEKNILLFSKAQSIDWIVTKNETESLLLERNLISEYKPRFNILLKYGDGYIGVAISKEENRRLFTWRGTPPKKADWFGPFPNVSSKDVINSLLQTFPVRSCNDKVFKTHSKKGRACMLYETNMCYAPCIGKKTDNLYTQLTKFLSGEPTEELVKIEGSMRSAAESENFEYAILKKRQLDSLRKLIPNQDIVKKISSGLFVTFTKEKYLNKEIISFGGVRVRNGSIIALQTNYALIDSYSPEILCNLLNQFLIYFKDYNHLYLTDELFINKNLIILDKDVQCKPINPNKHEAILELLKTNIAINIKTGLSRKLFDVVDINASLDELACILKVESVSRIECIDISHTLGAHPIASIVVLSDGQKALNEYRKINVPLGYGGDDTASIKYTLYKRYSSNKVGLKEYPDVILIDGGKPQCNAASEVIDEIFEGSSGRPLVISIAKRMEEVFIEKRSKPLILSRESESLKILMSLRDQAHNHAIRSHRAKRDENLISSYSDDLKFLKGAVRRVVLSQYPTRSLLSKASMEDLMKIDGISNKLAKKILEFASQSTEE